MCISLDQLPFQLLEKQKDKLSELLLLLRMSLSCQVCNYYFPMSEVQNNYLFRSDNSQNKVLLLFKPQSHDNSSCSLKRIMMPYILPKSI